jgi:hemerythrin-like domain-containing protein
MVTATSILRDEHKAILKMIDTAEEVSQRLKKGVTVSPELLSGLLEFFRTFADRCHHGKEEECLFPLLEQRGIPREGGPIGVMLHEHDQGRGLIRVMGEAACQFAGGRKDAGLRWADAALAYSELLRNHISKENDILFVMADRFLSEADQITTVEAFGRIETEKLGAGTHERLHTLMNKLYGEVFPGSK